MKSESPDASTQFSDDAILAICRQVQHNCAVSDAIYAREYTLCVYLLRMREYYRWQNDIPPGKHLSLDDVGDWVSETEQYWDAIEEQPFLGIQFGDVVCDPFDCERVNSELSAETRNGQTPLIYSAGLGRRGQPHFLLAEAEQRPGVDGIQLYVCTNELARDINSPVAMTRGSIVVVSLKGLQRMLWELYEEWSFHRHDGPMSRLCGHYGWNDGFGDPANLEAASAELLDVLIAHECGEVMAGDILPGNWSAMMESAISVNGSTPNPVSVSNELYLRAVRDNLADSLQTWPAIVDSGESVSLDFWLASLGPIRRQLLDDTDFASVLSLAGDQTQIAALAEQIPRQFAHWQACATAMSDLFRRSGHNSDFTTLFAH